eukprot:CAMPEP_0113316694 /NCGR_PEP_ID=MMETSP0010_2-20120614/11877_1 /TAXON_ID=216773 ORGANISM="Corethron hystrix, Strain 308" /NCGR_SAMPLE_ID=MMETSP0010_2 /ASSEMBLY_ACC=CAM_ASM_000155 /LENGTH=229 /DNA_ID=CAMNT_0000173481 /DNA_START=107 /DNA_END=793 /DNA_ORIENTATION=- /assembly_acc=CAM_ASM_000155
MALPIFTDRMRSATKSVHDKSDRLVNLKLGLVLTSHQLYGEAIGLFAPIYCRLEEALERHRDGRLGCIAALLEDLRRTPKFDEDILFYLGEDGVASIKKKREEGIPEELKDYLDHLNDLEREDPLLLVPYIYHLFMAIMAGGYIIKKMVKRAMGLKKDNDEGVMAFSFTELNCAHLRRRLKHAVNNELKLSKEEEEKILKESEEVFNRNNLLVGTVQNSQSFNDAVRKW